MTTIEPDTSAAALLSAGAATFKVADDPDLIGSEGDDSIVATDPEGNELPPEPAGPKPFALMTEDAFFEQFCMAFEAPAMLGEKWEPLAIPAEEMAGARHVSNRMYNRCANSNWAFLRDFVNDNGGALLEWGMMAHFVFGRTRAVGQIMGKKAPAQASPEMAQAPTPESAEYAAPLV